ncbi:LPS export ABC transporter periplasmic protein LptC [Paradesertivirga mongoliensis]|uniref:LPS export ABC transporter periplasmic protein LptC n=1 Tax=Paradesertivirga mongoliensis TaxID=2100740 RepID=UPI00210C2C7C
MRSFKRYTAALCLVGSALIVSCENDLKEIEKISSRTLNISVDTSKGVEIIISDSAVVKGKLITPVLLNHKAANPYHEMPNGLTAIFYDENQKESSRITADHGYSRENGKLIELRKNVVVTTQKGDVLKSEELFYDEKRKVFYSNQLVNITKPDGTSINGTSFESDQNFDNPIVQNATGTLATGNKLTH